MCSNLLLNLNQKDILEAKIQKNKDFHFPNKEKNTILIANGTGIAPFLGMLDSPTTTHLFWGGRTLESLEMYNPFLSNLPKKHIYTAFSQEQHKKYVQDLVFEEKKLIVSTLRNGGIIMVCGSISMLNGVLIILEKISLQELNTPIDKFKKRNQIKTDCY